MDRQEMIRQLEKLDTTIQSLVADGYTAEDIAERAGIPVHYAQALIDVCCK